MCKENAPLLSYENACFVCQPWEASAFSPYMPAWVAYPDLEPVFQRQNYGNLLLCWQLNLCILEWNSSTISE